MSDLFALLTRNAWKTRIISIFAFRATAALGRRLLLLRLTSWTFCPEVFMGQNQISEELM